MSDYLVPGAAPPGSRSCPPARPAPSRASARPPRPPAAPLHAGCGSARSLADSAGGRGRRGKLGRAQQVGPRLARVSPRPSRPGAAPPAAQDPEAWVGPPPGGMTVRFGHYRLGTRSPCPAVPGRADAPRLAALPAGPSRPTRGRSGPGPPRYPSLPRTPSARLVAPPPSSPRGSPKPLRPLPRSALA